MEIVSISIFFLLFSEKGDESDILFRNIGDSETVQRSWMKHFCHVGHVQTNKISLKKLEEDSEKNKPRILRREIWILAAIV